MSFVSTLLHRPFHWFSVSLMALGLLLPINHAWSNQDQTYQRIISLSPHITELIYSAGAGDKLVGVVEYSDFPEAAQQKPVIGRYNAINIEAIITLQPDLIIAWQSGNRVQDIERLTELGFNVWQTDIKQLQDIPWLIKEIGQKTGFAKQALSTSKTLLRQLSNLQIQYAEQPQISAFYQIWNKPLITMNGEQYISLALDICNAKNSFTDLPMLASEVSLESVMHRNPQIIFVGGKAATQQAWYNEWLNYPNIQAVQEKQIYKLDNDQYQRPTARLINGLEALCDKVDQARKVYK